jgi:hypothetical protein
MLMMVINELWVEGTENVSGMGEHLEMPTPSFVQLISHLICERLSLFLT